MNYQEVRQVAYRLSDTITKQHPCRRGKARCCEATATITEEDAVIIWNAYLSGRIPRDVMEDAFTNSRKPGRTSCAFLSKDKSCTIYKYRPAICALTGTGAALSTNYQEEVDPQVQNYFNSGENTEIPFSKLTSPMCPDCHAQFIREGKTDSVANIVIYSQIWGFLRETASIYINKWINDTFRGLHNTNR